MASECRLISIFALCCVALIFMIVFEYHFLYKNDPRAIKMIRKQIFRLTGEFDVFKLLKFRDNTGKKGIPPGAGMIFLDEMNFDGLGLGNAIFMFASMYGVAQRNEMSPGLLTHDDLMLRNAFDLRDVRRFTDEDLKNRSYEDLEERKARVYDERVLHVLRHKIYRIQGFRQSWKYFDDYRLELVKNILKFRRPLLARCQTTFHEILGWEKFAYLKNSSFSTNILFVGVHARRGDFLNCSACVPANSGYLLRAMRFFEKTFINSALIFIVLGDEYEWNQANVPWGENVVILEPQAPELDLCILSQCNHTIITSGTFGWWAAYLCGGTTVYMKDQCTPLSDLCNETREEDYINPDWPWIPM